MQTAFVATTGANSKFFTFFQCVFFAHFVLHVSAFEVLVEAFKTYDLFFHNFAVLLYL